MVTYRCFRNTDPPLLVDIWRSRAGQRGLLQPVSADLFEQFVFAKLYFDYEGLILALDDGHAVGFAHAGFGPDEEERTLCTRFGVTCVVLTRPDCSSPPDVAAGLLAACESYLQRRGAQVLYGGALQPLNPFYLGLYGGSELPGILQSDTVALELFRAHHYREIDQTLILERNLQGFQAPISREQLQLRRQLTLEMLVDAPVGSWWQASTTGDFDLTRFDVHPRGGGSVLASATFRNMDPSGAGGLTRAAGLMDLSVEPAHLRQGLATYLLSEAFQHFLRQGITVVEAQTMQRNTAARGLYEKLGFTQIDQGLVFRKNG